MGARPWSAMRFVPPSRAGAAVSERIPDVLVVTALIDGAYPSVNTMFAGQSRGGGKTPEYKRLRAAVMEAAKAEIQRTGWVRQSGPCRVWVTRYVPDSRRRDASNLGKCELDALEKVGVYDNDELCNPVTQHIVSPDIPPDRVVIVVQRAGVAQTVEHLPRKQKRAGSTPASSRCPKCKTALHDARDGAKRVLACLECGYTMMREG